MTYKANIAYVYTRDRRDFGRACRFKVEGPLMMFNEAPNPELRQTHIRQNPMSDGTQINELWGLQRVETDRVPYKRRSENHTEGGWPKDINPTDSVVTARFAKKIERDEDFIQLLPRLYERSYRWLIQNSALNIFDEFEGEVSEQRRVGLGQLSCRKMNIYNDMSKETRPCISVTFCANPGKFATAYNDLIFQKSQTTDFYSYVWRMENPNDIDLVLDAGYPCCKLEYSPRDAWAIAGGLSTGQVAFWDTRLGSKPVRFTPFYDSFREPVSDIKWLNTKDGMNIFSSSSDGTIKWWDMRDLSLPVEELIVDITKTTEELSLSKAFGVSCLEYEPTISTKFMIGTDNGLVISGNRKGKTMQEKLQTVFKCGVGPICNIQRNPYYLKNFIVVTGWSMQIWTEDFKEQAIMWSKPGCSEMISAAWSPMRFSTFFIARRDGVVEAWDLADMTNKPVLTIKASDSPLECMAIHQDGRHIAVGSSKGTVTLLEVSKHFTVVDKTNKLIIQAIFDRESRREKLLEGKLRELRLKAKGAIVDRDHVTFDYDSEQLLAGSTEYFSGALQEYEQTGKVSKFKPVMED